MPVKPSLMLAYSNAFTNQTNITTGGKYYCRILMWTPNNKLGTHNSQSNSKPEKQKLQAGYTKTRSPEHKSESRPERYSGSMASLEHKNGNLETQNTDT